MKMSPFSAPFFWGTQSERPLLPKRAGALWERPVVFRRSRESRSGEAAGRRNWPEAVPRKVSGRKRSLTEISWNRDEEQTRANKARREPNGTKQSDGAKDSPRSTPE